MQAGMRVARGRRQVAIIAARQNRPPFNPPDRGMARIPRPIPRVHQPPRIEPVRRPPEPVRFDDLSRQVSLAERLMAPAAAAASESNDESELAEKPVEEPVPIGLAILRNVVAQCSAAGQEEEGTGGGDNGGGGAENGGSGDGGGEDDPPHTKPSGERGGKPTGPRADEKRGSKEQRRGHKRENESADILANEGYNVKQGPPKQPNGTKPDYQIEGNTFDCYAPTSTNEDTIRKGISDKVRSGQADRIVLNLNDSKVTPEQMKSILSNERKPVPGLKEVITIKGGKITHIHP
jgi:Contact-dependent growth inhibition CdiA C-terminal domain